MNITDGKVVSISYKLTNGEKQIIDQSKEEQPLVYLHGKGQIIPGLEEKLTDCKIGDKVSVVIEPEKGYGEYQPDLLKKAPRDAFKKDVKLEVGMQVNIDKSDNRPYIVTHFDNNEVILDGNHPLAGERLHFDVEIKEVREATAEEAEHGHVHPDGHHHE